MLDQSFLPQEKQNDPRLVKLWKPVVAFLSDPVTRFRAGVHEAAHAIYMERAGGTAELVGPQALYDSAEDKLSISPVGVMPHFADGVRDYLFRTGCLKIARYHVAGGIAARWLCGPEPYIPGYSQKDVDFEFLQCKLNWLTPEQINGLWKRASKDVLRDLRSKIFRRELVDRARSFDEYLLAISREEIFETAPPYAAKEVT